MIERAKLERLDPNRWIGVRAGELLDVLTRAESHDGCAVNDADYEPINRWRPVEEVWAERQR